MRFCFTVLLLLALTAADGFAQTQQPPPAPDGPRSKSKAITGRVVNESGQPLSGAFVHVRPAGPSGPYRRDQFAASDREGNFKIEGLESIPYLVEAQLPAYTAQPRESESSTPPQYRPGDSVTLVLVKGGVITGTVTRADGEPVVGIGVSARLVRDRNGQRRPGLMTREVATDDRGVYRIYGLPAGTYIAMADGLNDYSQTGVNAFNDNVATYAPSSTRDTAAEITVRTGEEVNNVDIRYRGERGRTISGIVAESSGEETGYSVTLHPVTPTGQEWHASPHSFGQRTFAFDGIPDGDYYLTAISHSQNGDRALSESKLINVRGADVTGLELSTQPLAEITGKVIAEELKPVECSDKTPPPFTEMTVSAWHREMETNKRPQFVWSLGAPARPDAQGMFRMRGLAASQYYFQTRVAARNWYLKSIGFASPRPTDATKVWTNVKSGDRLTGLTVTLAQGAASLSVKLSEGAEKLFIFLVPVEAERADEPLRFYGAAVTNEGKVELNNLAPGRYRILVQPVNEETTSPLVKVRLPDETRTRARLRREAEAAKTEIELKPCQQVVDFELPK